MPIFEWPFYTGFTAPLLRLMAYDRLYSASLTHDAVGWSAVCAFGRSLSFSLMELIYLLDDRCSLRAYANR